jgi:adenine-specific DNA-methyltransferase
VTDPLTGARAPTTEFDVVARDAFRPIQYLGSKVRLLDAISSAVDSVDTARGPVLDLFSGSGVVSAHLARRREVTAVDIQEYARVLASALLSPARLGSAKIEELIAAARLMAGGAAGTGLGPLLRYERAATDALEAGDPGPLCDIVEGGSLVAFSRGDGPDRGQLAEALAGAACAPADAGAPLTLTRYYGGVYFGYAQALALDCLLAAIRTLPASQRDTALAALLGAASECVTSVGNHFAQPVRPRDKLGAPKLSALVALTRRRKRDIFEAFASRLKRYEVVPGAAKTAEAVQADYRAFLASHKRHVAAAYADPPYTRDHYSRFYHVLETMARGDSPEISTVSVNGSVSLSRGLYRSERHQSPFCIRSEAPAAFHALFSGVRQLDAPLVLSYSPYRAGTAARPQPRLLTIGEVADLASEAFGTVRVRSAGRLSHSKFNVAHLNGNVDYDAEALLICTP